MRIRVDANLVALVLAKTLTLVFANPNPDLGPWYISYLQGTSAGPDGPWNVIQLPVDFPDERLLFYPGGSQTSLFISTAACNGSSAPCPLPQPTLWSNTGAHEIGKAWDGVEESPATWDALVASPLNMSGQGHYTEDRISLYPGDPVNNGVCPSSNTVCFIDRGAIFVSDNMTVNYPGGSKLSYTMDVGLFSLASPRRGDSALDGAVSYSLPNGTTVNVNSTLHDGYYSGFYPSESYGLHIGSAALNITGNLWLGGYDQARILAAPVVSAIGSLWLPLVDIGIGVVSGSSPFSKLPSGQVSGLLKVPGGASSLSVYPNPAVPYMYLPGSTCDAVAAYLPIQFNNTYGLYLWNTSDPDYQKITTSPSFLSFSFNSGTSTADVTINIPFALLTLNLTQPLANAPTPYFPCYPYNGDSVGSNQVYHLGRAFLQGAFLAQNWQSQYTWIAQAPGPALPQSNITKIASGDSTITPLIRAPHWADTWAAVLHALPVSSGAPSVSPTATPTATLESNTSSGLSSGSKIGIGVGVGLGVALFFVALGAFFVLRRRRTKHAKQETEFGARSMKTADTQYNHQKTGLLDSTPQGVSEDYSGPQEMSADGTRQAYELGDMATPIHEKPAPDLWR